MMMIKEPTYDNRSTSTTTTQTNGPSTFNRYLYRRILNGVSSAAGTIPTNNFREFQSLSTINNNNNINPFLQHQQHINPFLQHQQQRGDVTDNKTDILIYANNNRTPIMVDQLNNELQRLKTFDNWPCQFMDKIILAKIGMYYVGESDKVKCYFCDVIIGRWELDDNAITEHIRWSPNCPLLKRRTTNNQPIDIESLDRLLPPISYDVCGSNDMIEVRPAAYAEGTIQTPPSGGTSTSTIFTSSLNNTPISSPNYINYTNSTINNSGQNFIYPDHPEYAIESARLRSYSDCWPITMKQKPEQLSEAGFFYTGIGDRVKCFSCGGGLKDWDNHDDPWEQHALWLSNCRYLKLIKGVNFIEYVKEKYKNNDNNELTNQLSTSSSSSTSSTSSSPSKELRTTSTSTETNNDDDDVINKISNNINCCNKQDVNFNNNNNCCSNNKRNLSYNNCPGGDDLQQLKKHISDEKLCKICYAGEYNTAFLPCGHVVACAKCASSVTKCPMCRKPFTDVMRVYFS